MKYRFQVIPELCTGCRTCELACAFKYAKDGIPGTSRIYPLAHAKDQYVPVVCFQCDDAACVRACMFDALKRNEETGAIDLDYERCVKCEACVAACPFGCALVDIGQNDIVKCDLCQCDPVCARFCPEAALKYVEIEE